MINKIGRRTENNDVFYVFAYTPLPGVFSTSPIPLIQQYVMQHGVRESLFNVSRRPQNPIVAADDMEMMMSEAQMLVERLRQSGVGEMALQRLFRPTSLSFIPYDSNVCIQEVQPLYSLNTTAEHTECKNHVSTSPSPSFHPRY
ncbi:MAG: hypothetical protein K5899_03650 [Bacteroidaceae bacterium]|nr:hypothetical protein [Bacteroidaceae bacterium]